MQVFKRIVVSSAVCLLFGFSLITARGAPGSAASVDKYTVHDVFVVDQFTALQVDGDYDNEDDDENEMDKVAAFRALEDDEVTGVDDLGQEDDTEDETNDEDEFPEADPVQFQGLQVDDDEDEETEEVEENQFRVLQADDDDIDINQFDIAASSSFQFLEDDDDLDDEDEVGDDDDDNIAHDNADGFITDDQDHSFQVLQASGAPTVHGGIQKVDPNAPTPSQLPASFSSFDNAQPQNEGNCLDAINKERIAAGVPSVQMNATLVALTAKHSAYMAAAQVASHDGFWSYRFDAVPATFGGVGEVVVVDDVLNAPNGFAKRAVDRWMGQAEHKALLLRSDMLWVGCSTADGTDGRFYATAMIVSQ
jgi:uncharacterized protein YkwD